MPDKKDDDKKPTKLTCSCGAKTDDAPYVECSGCGTVLKEVYS